MNAKDLIHDEEPARLFTKGVVLALLEGPEFMRICPRCTLRGIARGLRELLDKAAEADHDHSTTHGAELRAECLRILDDARPAVVEGPEQPQ